MSLLQFSPYKIMQLYGTIADYRVHADGLFKRYPVHVKIDLTEACNHRCEFCFYNDENRDIGVKRENISKGTRSIPFDKLKATLLDLSHGGTQAITLIGGGEPTLHPHFKEILQTLASIDIQFGMVSNGARGMDEETFDLLLKSTWLRFSIDTLDPQTYLELHNPKNQKVDNLPNTLDNLKTILARRSQKTVVGASFLIHPLNYTEIVSFAQNMKEMGVDYVEYKPMYMNSLGESQKEFFLGIRHTLDEVKKVGNEKFKVIVLMDRMSDNTFVSKDYTKCWMHYFTTHIGVDGEVYPCCVLAYAAEKGYGNLKQQSFADIWLGEKRKKIIESLTPDRCPRCWSDKTNELIEHILFDSLHPFFI